MIEKTKTQLAAQQIREFLEKMQRIGFDRETTLKLIQQTEEKEAQV